MKKKITVTMLSILLLTGCRDGQFLPMREEIDELNLIRVIAVDKSEVHNQIKVTVTSQKAAGDSGGQSGEGEASSGNEQVIVLSSMEKTVQAAIRHFQTYTNKHVFWGHSNFYLIGEDAAKEDIVKYLDFFARDHNLRPNSEVYIIYGQAGDILERSNLPGFFIADFLESLKENKKYLATSGSMEVLQLMVDLDENRIFGIAVPTLSLDGELTKAKGTQHPLTKGVRVEGYAVIKDFKLVGYINQSDSRGYNLIKNEGYKAAFDITDQEGEDVGMEIMGVQTKIIPRVENGQLVGVRIISRIEANIDEVHTKRDIFKEDSLKYLEHQQSEVIKKEMENIVKLAKKLNADFLGIGKAVHQKHPVLWERMKDQWNELFQELDIEIKVESHINRTYDIREPNGYRAGV